MKTYGTEFHYYEIGDVVAQPAYPGHLGKVVEINENHGSQDGTTYRVEIDVSGTPEAFDENGDPQPIKYACVPRSWLMKLNPDYQEN